VLESLENGWKLLVEDESIFIHDSHGKKKKMDFWRKRTITSVTGS
jgi:hypothetical protein